MRDNTDLQNDVDRMNKVESILNNSEYQRAFIQIKSHILSEFEKLNYSKIDDMAEANRKLKTLAMLESTFEQVLTDGKIAEQTLTEKLKSIFTKAS